MTRADKDTLATLVEKYSLSGVLHQLAELCYEKDSEEREKTSPWDGWAHNGDALEALSDKCGC